MQNTVNFIKEKTNDFQPEIGIILGSGLGELADEYCDYALPYTQIPNFVKSTVQGHKGRLVFAEISGRKVVMMQGRNHFYEGHTMQEITYPVKVMKSLGIKTLILTNAAGAVNESFKPADLMIITDHINFTGSNPLIGENDDTMGERFPDMSEVYKKNLVDHAKKCARDLNIDIKEGVYWANSGPSYETPAEYRMYHVWGADAVGMSTVPEVIVARHCGIRCFGISVITDLGVDGKIENINHEKVQQAARSVQPILTTLFKEMIKQIND